MSNSISSTVLCDSHVHFYGCFEPESFVSSAWNNFERQAESEIGGAFLGVLMLSEANVDQWFLELVSGERSIPGWRVRKTGEPESLYLETRDGRRLIVVSGRQIVTAENLEVLALATPAELEDGQPVGEVIDWALENDAVVVIPWGFGKWWGRRGEILSSVLDRYGAESLFLGDNSGRARFLGTPRHFRRANSEHRRILPGSDPLPFATEFWRPGSVGFHFNGSIDDQLPARSLRDYIRNPDTQITGYMTCERLLPFVKNQVAMQLRKRM